MTSIRRQIRFLDNEIKAEHQTLKLNVTESYRKKANRKIMILTDIMDILKELDKL